MLFQEEGWQGSVGGEKLHCIVLFGFSFLFYYYYYFYLPLLWHFTLLSIIKLFLCQHRNFSLILLLILAGCGGREKGFEQVAVRCLISS